MTNTDKVNILMVDDQPGKLLSYEAILADLGENLIKATSGREALEHLLKTDVAVVLMDVSMPELDGFELADMIRQHPRFQKTAIIFISAVHLTDLDQLQGYARGAVDYISVPVIPDLLRAKVSVFAELHRKARELHNLNAELERRVLERTEELRQRAELLNLASEAIFVHDLSGAITFWNKGAESLYGWTEQEALGKNIQQLLSVKFPVSRENTEAAILEKGYWQGEITHRTKAGGEVIVANRQALQTDNDGKPKGFLEINRDITEQKRTEAALRSSEKAAAMGRLAGTIAHEINNPIEAVKNAFYLLKGHDSLNEEARELARMAEEELGRISHITKQTLSFYRESQRPTEVSLSQVLDDVLGIHSRKLQMSSIRLNKDFTGAGMIIGFPGEMRQVFLNLIGNAIEAMPEGGILSLRLYPSVDFRNGFRPGIRVSVFDTGSGINPSNKKKIFEPFFSTKDVKGTGLGLWVTHGIVQKHEGLIRFRSSASPDGGLTCFSVFIPSQGYASRARATSNSHTAA